MITKRVAPILILALLVGVGTVARADSTEERGKQLLLSSLRAEREVSYTAEQEVEIFGKDGRKEVRTRIYHQAPDKTRIEGISPEHMAGMILVQKGQSAYRWSKKRQTWFPTRWGVPEEHTDLLLQNYRVSFREEGTLLGRKVNEIHVRPKRDGNPSKTLWLDKETGLVLRSELLNCRREKVSSVHFHKLDLQPKGLSPELFDVKHISAERRRENAPPWKPIVPSYLPAGYIQTGVSSMELRDRRGAHLKFSDGLNTISLFETRAEHGSDDHPRVQEKQNFSRELHWSAAGWEFVLVADLSPDELKHIADSVAPPK